MEHVTNTIANAVTVCRRGLFLLVESGRGSFDAPVKRRDFCRWLVFKAAEALAPGYR